MSALIFIVGFVVGDAIGAFLALFMIAYSTKRKLDMTALQEQKRMLDAAEEYHREAFAEDGNEEHLNWMIRRSLEEVEKPKEPEEKIYGRLDDEKI